MSVSIKPSPIIKGKAARRILHIMNHPTDNTELFKKCAELSKIFTTVEHKR
jgi:hypothetical protein